MCKQFTLALTLVLQFFETKIELDSHAATCVVGDHCLILHDHNIPLTFYGYDPKTGLMYGCVVNATVAYTVPETGQVVILSINQAIEMKGLDQYFLFPMQCCMNGVLIDEVLMFLAPIPSETTHAIQIENLFDATHPIIIPLKLNRVSSYFEVRKPTWEEYEDQNILKIELMAETPPWDLSSSDYSQQEQSMFKYK